MRRRARGGAGDRPARWGEEHEGNIVDIVSMLMHEIKYMLFQFLLVYVSKGLLEQRLQIVLALIVKKNSDASNERSIDTQVVAVRVVIVGVDGPVLTRNRRELRTSVWKLWLRGRVVPRERP